MKERDLKLLAETYQNIKNDQVQVRIGKVDKDNEWHGFRTCEIRFQPWYTPEQISMAEHDAVATCAR